jgi:hypothetical protein
MLARLRCRAQPDAWNADRGVVALPAGRTGSSNSSKFILYRGGMGRPFAAATSCSPARRHHFARSRFSITSKRFIFSRSSGGQFSRSFMSHVSLETGDKSKAIPLIRAARRERCRLGECTAAIIPKRSRSGKPSKSFAGSLNYS